MDQPTPKPPQKLSLPVLPDPDRLARVLANAEANQERRAMSEQSNPQTGDRPQAPSPPATQDLSPEQKAIEQKVVEVLKTVYDPEIPVNIYEMGLIYGVDVSPSGAVNIRMTLTAPACPVAESLPLEVESKVQSIPEVTTASVLLVWDPPWDRDRMSEAAKLQLGMM